MLGYNLFPPGCDLKCFGFEIIQAHKLSQCSRQLAYNTHLIHSCKLVHLHITMTYHTSAFTVQR